MAEILVPGGRFALADDADTAGLRREMRAAVTKRRNIPGRRNDEFHQELVIIAAYNEEADDWDTLVLNPRTLGWWIVRD